MIKELWHWSWMFFSHLFTFRWQYIGYHWINLWWYLRYGFAMYDLQDTDDYLIRRMQDMLKLFIEYKHGYPEGCTPEEYHKAIERMIELCDIVTQDIDMDGTVEAARAELFGLWVDYFYTLWY